LLAALNLQYMLIHFEEGNNGAALLTLFAAAVCGYAAESNLIMFIKMSDDRRKKHGR
jgi:hypothetical protein